MTSSIKVMLDQAHLLQGVSGSWQLDTELLLAAALTCSRVSLRTMPERALTAQQQHQFDLSFQRRLRGEPIAYILGRKEFWDFELKVDNRVLIPRPETELLVERALYHLQGREQDALSLADLGTGSGAIAIALARQSSHWKVFAVDKSNDALDLARENAKALALDNVIFLQSDWCDELGRYELDLIVSNPPYVDPSDSHLQHDGLNFEPELALVAENKGLAEIARIARQVPSCLKDDAWLLVEHGYEQRQSVADLLQQSCFVDISCWQDLAGLDRVTQARKVSQSTGSR